MSYRPQFAYPPAPPGYKDEEFVYYFDSTTLPALGIVPTSLLPLPLQADEEFRLRAFEISGNTGRLVLRFYTPEGQPMSNVPVENDLAYGSSIHGVPPGRLPVALPDEIVCRKGSSIFVDLDQL